MNFAEELKTYLCYRRLTQEDFASSKWSITTQKAGNWIEVKDISAAKWSIGQIIALSPTEIRVSISTWKKGRDEYLSRATCRNRVAKLGTNVNLYTSPSYPFTRKQGSMWNVGMKDLQQAREDFDQFFFDLDNHETYLPRHLIPFIEKSLLCMFFSSEMAEEMNSFHQHVLKNLVAKLLSNDTSSPSSDPVLVHLLALLRMIMNGHNSCMFFYIKYPGTYSATKYQKLMYTSYLSSPDVLATIPSRHPCRSFYFVDNVDLFLQAGGFRVILQRLALRDIALKEVALFCSLLYQAKPCLVQQKRRRSSSSKRRSASSIDTQVEDFFRDFLNATFARLRRMTGDELKDDEGLVDHVVGMLDMLYRDGILLGSSNGSISESDPDDYSGSEGPSSSACDGFFAEMIEVFHLDLSKKYICCPFLAQRLLGIARLNDLIAMAQRREEQQRKTSLGMRRSSSASGSFLGGYADSSTSSTSNQPVAKWLRVKYVVEWLSTSDVLEVIMGDKETCTKYELQEGTHLELLKRSKKIYEFVAVNGLLNENHVVLLWRTGMNLLRSGRKAVFDMLITLCGVISADLIDVVMMLLTQVPLSEYDELFTQFVKRIIMIASKQVVEIEASGSKKTLSSLVGVTGGSKLSSSAQKEVDVLNKVVNLGCCLLWNGILDGHDANSTIPSGSLRPAMRSEVESVLATSLNYVRKLWAAANSSSPSSKEQQKLLSEYLKKCADNIKDGVLVETSMSLIQRVADGYGSEASSTSTSSSMGISLPRAASFGASSRTSASPSDLLKDLNSKFGIVVAVTEEIKNYMTNSREPSDLSLHERSMRRRLTFLGYIVTRSEVELSYSLMEQVWKCFNGIDNTPEEREVFFEWLTGIIPDPSNFVHRAYSGNSAFASSVTTEIYQSLIKQQSALEKSDVGIHLDVKNMGKHAFWAFERLFRLINTNDRAISCAGVTGNGQRSSSVGASNQDDAKAKFVVESFDLKGLETLYEVALCAGSEDVSQEAINYLIHLHLHVGSKLVQREVWADFVNGCFERLEKKKASGVDEESAVQVHRLLVLLGTFLFQSVVQLNEAAETGNGSKDGPEELIVHVRTQDGRSAAPFRYQLRRTSLVGELRDRIAKDTGHPAERIRIVNEFKTKLTAQGHDKFTLEKARVFSSSLAAPSAPPSTAKISSASAAPLSSSGHHKRLNFIEAIMLSKVESDTVGHVQRSSRDVSGPLVKSHSVGINADAESDWQALKSGISSNGRYLQLLFTLLSQRVDICEEAWKVLKLLASNSEMEKRTRALNDTLGIDGSIRKFPASFDWDVMLDLSCPPKLLYQLELVERFAVCGDDRVTAESADNDDDDESSGRASTKGVDGMIGTVNRWSHSFLKLGGKEHLKKFVLACNPQQLVTQGSLSVMCLSKLLKLLRHFVLVEFRLAEQEEEQLSEDPQDLVYQLLEILSSLKALEEDGTSFASSTDGGASSNAPQDVQVGDADLCISAYDRPVLEDPDNIFALPSEAYMMTRTLSFVATCVLTAARDALPLLESYPSHGQIFLNCLVKSRFKPVRQEAANLTAALSTSRNKSEQDRIACCHFFLKLLSEYDGPVFDEEYYNVFTLLVSSADTLAEFAILPSCKTLCRRVKSFSVSDDHANVTSSGSSRLNTDEATTVLQPVSDQDPGSPDSLLEALLSTLLVILKRIPPVLAGRLDIPYRGRSLREVIASTLHEDEGIVDEIFHRCLFATPDNSRGSDPDETGSASIAQAASSQYYLQKPKCRSESSREVAFALLTELSQENTSGLRYLLEQMSSQHSLRAPPVPKTLAVEPPLSASKRKLAKSKEVASRFQTLERAKYVGLKNLGCTCYLNSTMQSFFMIPRFRRQILRFNADSSSNSSVSSSSGEAKGVLYELQSLFAHLEGTAKPYYNPKSFTSALKTWDGESIDVNIQQDASEFLTSFFQQIESEMNGMGSGHGDESILNNFFGGVFSNELVAEGGRYSERAEPFHFISVPVRDRKNLKESLDGWVEGDKVSYTWEKSSDADRGDQQQQDGDSMSDEKVTLETHKRISISRLPDQLIIHLKRFEFDFERMQQIKLHDRFEFPMELDMYPYTKEGQEEKRKRSSSSASEYSPDGPKSSQNDGGRTTAPEYSQYELVGTVVHMGTANSGHYYSFLREQDAGSENNQWFEFNDTVVSPFDPQQIPEECFGGEDDRRGLLPLKTPSASSLSSSSPTQRMKTRSSFMLIYARKKPKLQLSLGKPDQSNPISFAACGLVLAFCVKLKRAASSRLESLRSVAQVIAPRPIRNLIAMENRLFWRKKYLYDARCLSFTYEVIKSCLVGLDDSNDVSDLPRFEPTEARLVALQMATKFVFGTLWQGGNVSKVLEWRTALLALYHTEFDGCYWLLNTLKANEQLLLDLLVFNEHAEVRELLASVLAEAIATTSNFEFEENAKATDPSASSSSAVAGRSASGSGGSSKKLPASFEFIFFLIQLMPALLSVPVQHHSQYFMTIWDFVQTGRNEGAFLVVNSVVGAIVSLLTGLGNTQPLLQGQLKRYKSKQILKSIDLSVTVLKLLSVLIRCSLPPAMDVGKNFLLPPNMAHDHVDLTPSDHEVLLNERFITLLTQRASRYSKETKPLEQIVIHLCWESRRVTGMVMDKIMSGIEFEDHHDVKPYFRTLNTVLKLRDSLTSERLSDGMTKLIAVMASQQRFYKATEVSIDMLTRLAKRHGSVSRWLQENHMSCMWMEKWLSGHRGADGFLQQKKTVLVKLNSTSNWANVSVASSGLVKTIDRTVSKLLPRIRSILDPQAAMETFYDSDDNPSRLVGKRIRVKWAKDKWYEGNVEKYDEASYEHFVVYDDGDKRSYRMSEKQFYVVESSDKASPPSSGDNSSKKK